MHHNLPLFNFTECKDKYASYSFTKKMTRSMCQVTLVVKYILSLDFTNLFSEGVVALGIIFINVFQSGK